MSSTLVPYSRTEFGFKIAPPDREVEADPETRAQLHRPLLEGESIRRKRASQELLPTELAAISERTRSVAPALASLDRLQLAIEDQRLLLKARSAFVVVGMWNRAVSLLQFVGSPWIALAAHFGTGSDRALSAQVSELKRITENVVMPSLSQVREEYRGRSFVRDFDTPPALLLMAVPSDKVGQVFSFDSLRLAIDTRALQGLTTCDITRGEGRVVLKRKIAGALEQLELAYKRPGKVDVYVDGERRGSSWNDDALEVCQAFIAGRQIRLEKRQRFKHYTIC